MGERFGRQVSIGVKPVDRLGGGLFRQFVETREERGKTDTVADPDLRLSIGKVKTSVCAVDLNGVANVQALRQAAGVVAQVFDHERELLVIRLPVGGDGEGVAFSVCA